MPPVPRIAVVDLGTNSTRLLIADVDSGAGTVDELVKRSTVTRLGQGVDASGRLAKEAIDRVLDVLAGYRDLIDEHGANQIVALATSAVRDSENGDEFRSTLEQRFGFDARTISGDREAQLTFLGATSARAGDDPEPTLVIDIGGGSTEFVVGTAGAEPSFHVSTQSGAVRQTERHLLDDPPAPQQLDELKQEVRGIIEGEVPAGVRESVSRGIAVAGTATQLAAIDQELDPYDGERVHGYWLTRAACEQMLERLAAVALEERETIVGLDPARAPTIVAGAAILVTAMRAFGLEGVETSESDILHGAALTATTT
jgi:exopolyphosphatase/guanosine-5'-triphosphate,3'-diphosphate pyrophosphatase